MYATETVSIERPPDWRALMELGQRRFPDDFGLKQVVEVSGPDGGPIPLEARAAQAAERLRELKSVKGLPPAGPPPPADRSSEAAG